MSAALDALTLAIATNTLTVAQQSALTQALTAISPFFPTPDDSSSSDAPPDTALAREWIAALYAIQAGGGGGGIVPVTSVLGTAPIEVATVGPVATVSIDPATPATPGSLSAADKTKLNGLTPGAAVASVSATAPLASTGGTTPNLTIAAATDATPGSMSAADKTKLDGLSSTPVNSVSVVAPIALAGTAANPIVGFAGTDINASGLVDAISGPSPIPVSPAVISWTQGTIAPTLTQAQQANASAPQALSFTCQAPGAGATNATNGTPGGFTFNLPAPVNGGADGCISLFRPGGVSNFLGPFTDFATFGGLWLGVSGTTRTDSNYSLIGGPGTIEVNAVTSGSNALFGMLIDGATAVFLAGKSSSGQGIDLTGQHSQFGGGVGVAGMTPATTEPSSVVGQKTQFWSFTNGAFKVASSNGWLANLVAIGSGTLQTQKPFVDTFSSVVRTVSSATPTAFTAYTTISGTIGWINVRLKSKAATTAGGITTGDGASAEYRLGYKNVAGTVTLATAGITLLGSVQTTNALLTSVLTAAAAGATVVFSVTNVAGNTVDSLIDCTIDVC
jgi:hypothetical protein